MTDAETLTVEVGRVGKLTSDPELAYSQAGKAFCRARMVVDSPVTPGDWRGEKRSDWYDLVCFGGLAENVAASLKKGDIVVAVGRCDAETWTGRDGQEHTTTKILCNGLGPDLRFVTAETHHTKRAEPA